MRAWKVKGYRRVMGEDRGAMERGYRLKRREMRKAQGIELERRN